MYRPRTRQTLCKWLEGPAFAELIESGDAAIGLLLGTYEQLGGDAAWIFYCASEYVSEYGLVAGCKEATDLYHEALIIDLSNRTDIDYAPITTFLNSLNDWQTYASCRRSRKSRIKQRHKSFKWPIYPDPTIGEKVILANFLCYIVATIYSQTHENAIATTDRICIVRTITIFKDKITPWWRDFQLYNE
jgi:hypothetical protein